MLFPLYHQIFSTAWATHRTNFPLPEPKSSLIASPEVHLLKRQNAPLSPIQGELNSRDHITLLTSFLMILNLSLQTDLSLCNPLLCSRFTTKAAIFPFEIIQSLHVSLWGDLLCLIQAPRQYITENQGKGSNFLPLIHGNEIPYPRRLWWSNFLPVGRQTCQMPKVSPGGC